MRLLLVMIALVFPTASFAALIVDDGYFIYIAGPIEKGDDKRFSEIIGKRGAIVTIASPGGNVDVAMNIGRIIRAKAWAVTVPDDGQCASACVLLLAAGVQRIIYERARVTIHRPYLDGELENDGAYDANYKRMVDSLNKYFLEMNIPIELGSRMMAIPPHRPEDLSEKDLKRYMLSGTDPAYEQKQSSKESRELGITVSELNKRKAVAEQLCSIAYQQNAPGDLSVFTYVVFHYCEKAILNGQPADIVNRRLKAVLERKERIELLNNGAQESCVQAIVLAGESKDCEW